MASAHDLPFELHQDEFRIMTDPGSAGTITVDRQLAYVPLVSAGAEARTLARPTRVGVKVFLYAKTAVGTITLTVTGGFNKDGDTTFSFTAAGHYLALESAYDGTNYHWNKISDYGLGNIAPGDSAVLDELSGLTATAAELNQAADNSTNVEAVTTTNIISAAESGETFFLNSATGFVSTLPAVAAGLRYFFVVGVTPPTSGNHTIVTATGKLIYGGATVDGADVPASAENTISFVASTAIQGDQVYVICDGTNWYVNGRGTAAGSITFTAP